jgi:histidinol dehydrogenase
LRLLRSGEREFNRFLAEVENRATLDGLRLERRVRSILEDVRRGGDEALLHYTWRFDRVRLGPRQFSIRREEIEEAYGRIDREFVRTLKRAARRIRRFHAAHKKASIRNSGGEKGIKLGRIIRPLERVGIYVPGGKASYPSTVLMAAIPAKVAGVREIIMATPPQKDGISPAIRIAADLAGVDRIYQIGGVQAIGALAYGTESIPRVDKIVGPGNRYVAAAKRLVYGVVDIDMVAGPSEIVVVSGEETPPSFVAADLISQAEHDEMAMAILITASERFGREVRKEVARQLALLRRKAIAQRSLKERGAVLIVKDLGEAMEVVNRIAPEHLELCHPKAFSLLKQVKHAGAVFLGSHTPEALGDYLAGPNHILPTGGTARFSSALGVEDFVKTTNVIHFTRNAMKRFAGDVRRLTEWEGLEGHFQAIKIRMGISFPGHD